jgi:hypothetical protein
METATALNPAEARLLLRPNLTTGFETIKLTLTWMLMGGYLRLDQEDRPGLLLSRKVAVIRPTDKPPPAEPRAIAALLEVVRAAQPLGGRVQDVAKVAKGTFGVNAAGFNKGFVLPGLIERGLLEVRKFLVFKSIAHTDAGNREMERIKGELAQAKDIPALMQSDPKQAAARTAALGGLILLVPALAPHYAPLGVLMNQYNLGTPDYAGALESSGGFHLGSFDAGSLDTLSAGMGSFDAGFSDGGGGGGDGGSSSSD